MDREQWLEEKYQKHKGEWLNQKVAEEYRSRAKKDKKRNKGKYRRNKKTGTRTDGKI